jgi:predicted molibdopterin-dependent oxidoreductase YjgC
MTGYQPVADVVFSAASVAEKEGTVTNTERRCMRINKAIEPIGNTLAKIPEFKVSAVNIEKLSA